jgi:uncharacterized membrane protein required for colicin V production
MTWFDICILLILSIGIALGYKIGLIRTTLITIGAICGFVTGPNISEYIIENYRYLLPFSVPYLSIIVSSLCIIVGISIGNNITKLTKSILAVITLGLSNLVDKIGGIVLGLILAIIISTSIVVGLTRITYSFNPNFNEFEKIEILPDLMTNKMLLIKEIEQIAEIQSKLERTLLESSFVPYSINGFEFILRIIPGIFPQEFHGAIDLLDITREIYKKVESLDE